MGSIATPPEAPIQGSEYIPPKTLRSEPALQHSSYDVPPAKYPAATTAPIPSSSSEIGAIAVKIIQELNSMLAAQKYEALADLMASTSYWRDHLGLSHKSFTTLHGCSSVISFIKQQGSKCNIENFSLEAEKNPTIQNLDPKGTVKCLQAFITFETSTGRGRGVMKLTRDVENGDQWRIYTLFTTLYELRDFPFKDGHTRPLHAMDPSIFTEGTSWAEAREQQREYVRGTGPTVLIVGAGHSGLMTAARLKMIGIESLVIDVNPRTGDAWRLRYNDLILHDPSWMNGMPYLPYPPSWPILTPKDKISDFFEYYESALELNVWNSTRLIHSKWESDKKYWTVVLERVRDGNVETRTFNPKHLVQATGLNGEPRIPEFPGTSSFEGTILHSTQFDNGSPKYKGKKVIVVGTGTSGHDIAACVHRFGAEVSIVQRSSTYIMSLPAVHKMVTLRYNEDTPVDDSDLLSMASPTTLFKRIGSDAAAHFGKVDEPLLEGLKKAGFLTHQGEPPALLPLTIHRAGGFYLDIGTSSLIVSGAIKIKSGQAIASLSPKTMNFADGTEIEADEVIFCTGYENGRMRTRRVFGDSVADVIDPVWGYDEQGEIRGAWRRSGHPAFWVAAGPFWISRYYSRLLALQIKGVEEGLVGL